MRCAECVTQEDVKNMSDEQVIQALKSLRDMMCDQYGYPYGCPISSAIFALDKAIEALYGHKDPYEYYGKLEKAHDDGYEEGYCQAKFDYEPRWTPCGEKLSEEGHDVLITKESFKIKGYEQEVIKAKRFVDPRSGKIEWWSPEFGTLTNKAVLAWMPLPEPYRKEGD